MALIDMDDRINEAILACEKVLDPKTPVIPPHLLQICRGIAFITNFEARFGVSVSGGSGLLLYRDSISDKWSFPCAFNAVGAGVGLSVGVGVRDIILVFVDEAPLKQLVQKSDVRLSGQFGITVGPVGDDTVTSLSNAKAIFSYSFNEGFFAGVGLEISSMSVNKRSNKDFYKSDATPEEILFKTDVVKVPNEESAEYLQDLHDALKKMATEKEQSS
uniref:Ysc84 actin-binding domain-containing protein n=1 Tax=Ditylum brightwellii TaxID=49249 RepID=A0A7S4STQ3_9STRA|mmetsp:Transcript_36271/g.48602  ORF Transcript_36271/g.48602 Transcript_36271/m.48602 type:complete len:217 (+) Transcript_36271:58-708(+)